MKIKLLSAFFMLFTAIGFVSCDTEPVDPVLVGEDPTQNTPASFEVDFNNQTYQASTAQASVINGSIMISAVKADGTTFVITVPGTTTGTYTNATIIYTPSLGSQYIYANQTTDGTFNGQVTLASINTTTHKITGTFNFTGIYSGGGQADIAFTNGIFTNIAYTGTITPVDPVGGNSVFTAAFDGTTFTANDKQAAIGVGITGIYGMRTSDGDLITISVFGNGTGTYTGDHVYLEFYHEGSGEDDYYSYSTDAEGGSGTITISNIDTANHTISGTFSFTGVGSGSGIYESVNDATKQFSNGVFTNIPYVTDDVNGDACQATVNGTAVNYKNSIFYSGLFDTTVFFKPVGTDHMYQINIDTAAGTGTFPLEDSTTHTISYFNTAGVVGGTEYSVQEGSITVSSIANNRIQGTYTFVAKDSSGNTIGTVTNGTFDIGYDDF